MHHAHVDTEFYCFVLYSYQETSAKLNDHHMQEVTCCDFVIVLEDVHIFILYFMKFLVTHVYIFQCLKIYNIHFRAATRPIILLKLHPTNKDCRVKWVWLKPNCTSPDHWMDQINTQGPRSLVEGQHVVELQGIGSLVKDPQ